MRKRDVFPSLVKSGDVLEYTDTPIGRSIRLQFGARCRIDEVLVKVPEFEIHGLECGLGECGARGTGSSWRPVPKFGNIKGMEK